MSDPKHYPVLNEQDAEQQQQQQQEQQVCGDCRYWQAREGRVLSTCRRNPPVMAHESNRGFWPVVEEDGWCGEFAPAPPPPPRDQRKATR